ncbi:MAG: ABC-2 type transport system ATP-binding protein [Bradymonadia bacterium]|jgi:ABC-2 type transport system ATP-binding protein
MIVLDIQSLTKSYGANRAVDDVTFQVHAGELACFIGPNGAGKSTTMRTIAGLQSQDSGSVSIGGGILDNAEDRKRACTLTPQDVALFDYLTCVETLRLVGKVHGVDKSKTEQQIERWLQVTGLGYASGRMVRELSGGMKRKLAVACAMLPTPPLVLLDESFTGLDPESTRALQNELRSYCDAGGAVLLSSHILDMVHTMADRVVIMARGHVVESMGPADLAQRIPAEFADLTELYLNRTQAGPAS